MIVCARSMRNLSMRTEAKAESGPSNLSTMPEVFILAHPSLAAERSEYPVNNVPKGSRGPCISCACAGTFGSIVAPSIARNAGHFGRSAGQRKKKACASNPRSCLQLETNSFATSLQAPWSFFQVPLRSSDSGA